MGYQNRLHSIPWQNFGFLDMTHGKSLTDNSTNSGGNWFAYVPLVSSQALSLEEYKV